jgi:hypothetical protein
MFNTMKETARYQNEADNGHLSSGGPGVGEVQEAFFSSPVRCSVSQSSFSLIIRSSHCTPSSSSNPLFCKISLFPGIQKQFIHFIKKYLDRRSSLI